MLEIKNVYKTFNAGTVNEKVALNGLDLKLEDGDFVTVTSLVIRQGAVSHTPPSINKIIIAQNLSFEYPF